MHIIEMKTIVEAQSKKENWFENKFLEFMEIWAKRTENIKDVRIDVFYCYDDNITYAIMTDCEDIIKVYDGDSRLMPASYASTETMMEMAHNFETKINETFKRIQNDIEPMSVAGQELQKLIDKLK